MGVSRDPRWADGGRGGRAGHGGLGSAPRRCRTFTGVACCRTRRSEVLARRRGRAAARAAAGAAARVAVGAGSTACLCVSRGRHRADVAWAVGVAERLGHHDELDLQDAIVAEPLLRRALLHPPARARVAGLAERGVRHRGLPKWKHSTPVVARVCSGPVGRRVPHTHRAPGVNRVAGRPHLRRWHRHRAGRR